MTDRLPIFACKRSLLACVCTVVLFSSIALADNPCNAPGEAPDVIVGDLHQVGNYGTVSGTGISAFSVGTVSCNIGTCWLNWFETSPLHPVIGGNMFRLHNGRMEQIGQSWLKHGFFALSEFVCFNDCQGTDGTHLGVHCSDPYTAGLNGQQSNLGPKSDVNAATGVFPWPFSTRNETGNAIYKRLQVRNTDLSSANFPGARYFVEGQYTTQDDSAAGKNKNNASYREISVTPSGQFFTIALMGSTVRQAPGSQAWKDIDPSVELTRLFIDGHVNVVAKVTDLGNGQWHYEYGIHNMNSDRSIGSVSIPIPWGANVSNIGFHDVDYHGDSNDQAYMFDGTDWAHNGGEGFSVTWQTEAFDVNQKANAVRWGTMYNFRFDADVPPTNGKATLGVFKPGLPESLQVSTLTPTYCDADGVCDPGEDCTNCAVDCSSQGGGGGCCGDAVCNAGETSCSCLSDCGAPPVEEFLCGDTEDDDCDGLADCNDPDCCSDLACAGADNDGDGFEACDCNDGNDQAWSAPGEVEDLTLVYSPGTGATLSWVSPLDPGGNSLTYAVIRTQNPINFMTSTDCLADGNPSDTSLVDAQGTPPGSVFFYEVRAQNGCPLPENQGPLGRTSENIPREGRTCP